MNSTRFLLLIILLIVMYLVYTTVTGGGVLPDPGPTSVDAKAKARAALALAQAGTGSVNPQPGPDNPRPGPGERTCPQCDGKGEYSPDHSNNFFVRCDMCSGTGKITTGVAQDLPPGWNPECTCTDCNCGENCTCSATECSCKPYLVMLVGPDCEQCSEYETHLDALNTERASQDLDPLDVRTMSVELESVEARRLWAGRALNVNGKHLSSESGLPAVLPCFVRVQGGKATHHWGPYPEGSQPGWAAMLEAQPKPLSRTSEVVPRSPFVRVRGTLPSAAQWGSGAIVGQKNARVYVLTNSHCVREILAGENEDGLENLGDLCSAIDVYAGGDWYTAKFLGDSVRDDTAVLTFNSNQEFRVLPVAKSLNPRYPVDTYGFPTDSYQVEPRRASVITKRPAELPRVLDGYRVFYIQVAVSHGESGGAVLQGGRLVGLVQAVDNRPPATFTVCVDRDAVAQVVSKYVPL